MTCSPIRLFWLGQRLGCPQSDALLNTDEWSFQQVAFYVPPNFVNCRDRGPRRQDHPSILAVYKIVPLPAPVYEVYFRVPGDASHLVVSRWYIGVSVPPPPNGRSWDGSL